MDEPLPPEPCEGRSASDSESDELLKSTFSAAEDGAMMEGRMMPSPSSPTTEKREYMQGERQSIEGNTSSQYCSPKHCYSSFTISGLAGRVFFLNCRG